MPQLDNFPPKQQPTSLSSALTTNNNSDKCGLALAAICDALDNMIQPTTTKQHDATTQSCSKLLQSIKNKQTTCFVAPGVMAPGVTLVLLAPPHNNIKHQTTRYHRIFDHKNV
jgi:hypothetical protein